MRSKKPNRSERLAELKSWEASGLSITDYCKRRGIKKTQFYYWRKQYKQSQLEEDGLKTTKRKGSFIHLKHPKESTTPTVEGSKAHQAAQGDQAYKFIFPNGIILQVLGDLSVLLLKKIKDA